LGFLLHATLEWHHHLSPSKPRKFKQALSTRKIMARFLGPERRPSGWVHATRHNHQLRIVLCNSDAVTVRNSKPTAGPIVKRCDAPARQCAPARCCQNASNASRVWLGSFWASAYSPDLAPSDFHLFPKLKEFLGGRRFRSD
jgi:hypothetical protein